MAYNGKSEDKMAKFSTGRGKTPGSGAVKGQKYKKKVADLIDGLAENGCNFDLELGNAIKKQNAVLIRALSELLPYIRPRFKEVEQKIENEADSTIAQITDFTTEQLLRDVSGH